MPETTNSSTRADSSSAPIKKWACSDTDEISSSIYQQHHSVIARRTTRESDDNLSRPMAI